MNLYTPGQQHALYRLQDAAMDAARTGVPWEDVQAEVERAYEWEEGEMEAATVSEEAA